MEEQTVFEILHNMDKFTNSLIVQWNKTFNEDLGVSHILTLGYLYQNGKSRPSQIAKELGLTPPTVTHLCEKLVKRELLERSLDKNDRRIILLQITEKGETILHRANKEGHHLRKQMFEKLSEDDLNQLLTIYKKLNG